MSQLDIRRYLEHLNVKYGVKLKTEEVSDGYHTFGCLYEQRCILFAALVNTFPDLAWKTHRHEDGELCFNGGWFLVGIDTPEGSYTYHFENKNWPLFHCREVERAPEWDGHTADDVERLMSLEQLVLEDNT